MRGYAIKPRFSLCLLGLTLLAGCNSLTSTQEANAPSNFLCTRRPSTCSQWSSAAPVACRRPPDYARFAGVPASTPLPVGQVPTASLPAVLPNELAVQPRAIPVAIEAAYAANCACACPRATRGRRCTLCPPCVCCTTGCATAYSPGALARLSFNPPAEPQKLPDLQTPVKQGDILPAPEPPQRRRSYVDITAAACFGHAPDYAWVSGQVEYSRVRKEWRLRYASVDETDRYGGRLVLIENEHLSYLRDGQYVRLQGHLVNPNDASGSPAVYRIEAFKLIDKPNAPPPAAN